MQNIPVIGFVDIENVKEDDICEIQYEIKNISVKPNNAEEHSIYFESEIEIECSVYEKKQVNIIEDLYSTQGEVEYKQKNIKIVRDKQTIKQTYNFRKQENIVEIGDSKIIDVDVKPNIVSTNVANGRVSYDGELNLLYMYESKSGNGVLCKNIIEPFSFNIADDSVRADTFVQTEIEITMQDFIVMPDQSIEQKIDLVFELSILNMENMNVISEIKNCEGKEREKYSIVIYYAKNGDTLWKIAKRFGSTIDSIAKINKIENVDLIYPGQQLFIPR